MATQQCCTLNIVYYNYTNGDSDVGMTKLLQYHKGIAAQVWKSISINFWIIKIIKFIFYFSEQNLQIIVLMLLFIHFVSKLYRNACYLISKRMKVMVIYKITLTEKIHNFQVACKDFCVTLSGFAPIKCTKKHICYL